MFTITTKQALSPMTTTTLKLPETSRERGALVDPLAQRIIETLRQVLTGASIETLKEAAAAATGAGSIAVLVSHLSETSPALAAADPEAAAIARAVVVKQRLLAETPSYTTSEVAQLLAISSEAVRKQRISQKLLAIEHASDWYFPAWQFTTDGVLPGLKEVLEAMPVKSAWVRLELFTSPIESLDSKTIIDLLRSGSVEDIAEAVDVVSNYGDHGA